MTDSLNALEDWAAPLLRQLQPDVRNQLARNLRGKQGRIRRKAAMFSKMRTARYLKAKGDGNAISVGFTGRIARIARVHQYGLRYAQREVLGLTVEEMDVVRDRLLKHLGT